MSDFETMRFSLVDARRKEAGAIMEQVLEALQEKGYDPVSQLAGYFLSDDPTYITNHKNARAIIRRMEREDLLEEILRIYILGMGNE